MLKKHSFYLVKCLRTAKSKQKSKDVLSAMTNKQQPFGRGPLLGQQQIKGRGRMSRKCSPKITQKIHGSQANNNTKTNIGHSFKDTPPKTLSFKNSIPSKKISLSYPQYFNVSRVHLLVRALFPTNPIPQVPLAGTSKFFHLNWAKITHNLNILNIVPGFEIPFLEKSVQGK